jgi:hypothetical protein
MGRQTDGQTDKQTDRHIERQTYYIKLDRQTVRQKDRHIEMIQTLRQLTLVFFFFLFFSFLLYIDFKKLSRFTLFFGKNSKSLSRQNVSVLLKINTYFFSMFSLVPFEIHFDF